MTGKVYMKFRSGAKLAILHICALPHPLASSMTAAACFTGVSLVGNDLDAIHSHSAGLQAVAGIGCVARLKSILGTAVSS